MTASLRALRTAMIGYAAAASIAGNGSALAIMGRSLIGLLNPLRLVSFAFRALKLALIGSGIGAIVVGIAMAGTWIYNNWQGIKELLVGVGEDSWLGLLPYSQSCSPSSIWPNGSGIALQAWSGRCRLQQANGALGERPSAAPLLEE